MKTQTTIASALLFLCLLPVAACGQKDKQSDGGGNASPKPQAPADVELGHGYVRKDGAIHFIGGGTTGTGADATRIDTPSRGIFWKLVSSQYGPFQTAEGLDAASFEALSEVYTRDKNRVYYKIDDNEKFIVIQLPQADPASFSLSADGLVRDKSHVWFGDRILSGVDPGTVEVINPNFTVIKDKDSVHYRYDQILGADPATFRHIGSGYYADSNKVYWCLTPIPDADPASFKVLGDSFVAKDKNHAFRSGEILEGYDAASLELILHNDAGYQIFSDKNGIHVNKMTFPRAKPGQAEVIDNRTVKVGNLILLVEDSRNTPATLFNENGNLMVESPAYEPTSGKVEGMITAKVTADGLKDLRITALPGSIGVPEVPDWQMEVFTYGHTAERLIELGKRIK